MCTLTWHFSAGGRVPGAGYQVHFNRDERRARKPALRPAVERIGGVPVIMPTDADAGGTWISVNAHGVTLTLLNAESPQPKEGGSAAFRGGGRATSSRLPILTARQDPEALKLNGYRFLVDPDGAPPPGARSRGLLVRDLADRASSAAVGARLGELELGSYQPFTLVAFANDAPARCFEWSGGRLEARDLMDSDRPVCSSSVDQERAERERAGLWREMLSSGELCDPAGTLARFHASHEPERGAASVCMHRADARTVSYSIVSVRPRGIRFDYVPGPPCSTSERVTLEIERTPAAVS